MKEKEILRCICILRRVYCLLKGSFASMVYPSVDFKLIFSSLDKVIQALESEVDV